MMIAYNNRSYHLLSLTFFGVLFACLSLDGAKAFIVPMTTTHHHYHQASGGSSQGSSSFHPYTTISSSSSSEICSSKNALEEVKEEELQMDDNESSNKLLMEAIQFNTTAASILLNTINQMREDGKSREEINVYLESLLLSGPDNDSSRTFWTRSKRMARFSKRARMASLRRTLDITTPPPSSESSEENSDADRSQRRCRAFLTVLRSLADDEFKNSESTVPLIVSLEKKALLSLKDDTNLRKRLPEGLETPDYDLITKKGNNVEFRHYKPYSVCAVTMNKPRPIGSEKTDAKIVNKEMSGASSFGALAGYLFGKNEQKSPMKMTTPVFTSPLVDEEKQMEFVLPSEYWNENENAPQPLSGSGVTLQKRESEDRAVLLFGGYASKKEVDKRKKELVTVVTKDSDWTSDDDTMITLAQYNDPFTVPWRRLNEVSVKVVKK